MTGGSPPATLPGRDRPDEQSNSVRVGCGRGGGRAVAAGRRRGRVGGGLGGPLRVPVFELSELLPELFEPPALVFELLPLPFNQRAQVVRVTAKAEAGPDQQHGAGQP